LKINTHCILIQAHNLKVVGSNPAPATNFKCNETSAKAGAFFCCEFPLLFLDNVSRHPFSFQNPCGHGGAAKLGFATFKPGQSGAPAELSGGFCYRSGGQVRVPKSTARRKSGADVVAA
jgi:hypothetical protein